MTPTQGEHAQTALAHELFAAAQLAPGEGIEDAVRRIAAALTAAPAQPAAPQGGAYAELPARRRSFFCTKCGGRECEPNTLGQAHPVCKCGYMGFAEDLDYTADQMRDFADRTHTLRTSNGQAPALAENGHLTQAGHDLLMEATLAGATLVSKGRFVGDMAQAAPAAGAVAGPPNAITASVMRDDGGEQTAFCLMAAYRSEKDAMDALAMLAAAPTPAAQADSQPTGAEHYNLLGLLAECRDAFPLPEIDSQLENQWMSAMGDPSEVPGYLRAVSELMQDRTARKQGGKHD